MTLRMGLTGQLSNRDARNRIRTLHQAKQKRSQPPAHLDSGSEYRRVNRTGS